MPTTEESVFMPAVVIMSGRILGYVAAFMIPVVLTRTLDPATFGEYKQLFLVYSTLFGIAQFGMAESLYYFVPGSGLLASNFIANSTLALALAGAGSWILLWWFRSGVATLLGNAAVASQLPFVGAYLFCMLIAVVLEIVLTIKKRHLAASFAYGVSDIARFVLYILPVMWFHSLRALLIGAITFAALRCVVAMAQIARECGHLQWQRDTLSRQVRYAAPFGAAAIVGIIQMNLHQYVVSYYFDAATFAVYSVGCLQVPLTDFLMTSTSNVMMVSMREKLELGQHVAVLNLWRDTTRKLVMVFCLLAGGLIVTANPLIVLLFTDTYRESIPIFMLWSTGTVLAGLMTDSMLRVYAQTRFLVVLSLVRLVFIGSLVVIFLETWGLLGAVMVTMAAAVLAKAIALVKVKSIMQVEWAAFLPWRDLAFTLVAALVAGVAAMLAKGTLEGPGIWMLLVGGSVYAAVYTGALFALGLFTESEKSFFRRCTRSLGLTSS